ncbi:hypothetical protein IC220_04905 [Wolbachia endosymbiont of Pentalonia nigronervosa]|uniref:hypothetical protein n=1 Tax=Wolbachia endosymbiont of Pentalonia nigronervosa TaxID=1301914 RepID=UPI00165F4EA9|nr:hypothetical protein [Wolbachia endosymbiont of Pentalonia nigronervosa]MBD0391777.1 hypothetical protein [Wolbachia endosymbiont of Pentalonia nigronervosa]
MTTPCLLNNVETTLQTNLNTLNSKIEEIKGDLQQNLETCLQNISKEITKVEENFLGPKGQTTQTTDPKPTTADGVHNQPSASDSKEAHSISQQSVQQDTPVATAQLEEQHLGSVDIYFNQRYIEAIWTKDKKEIANLS